MKTYIFYIAWPNASWDHEEEFTEEELWIDENTTQEDKDKILEETFMDFLSNIDHWWYIKK